MSLTRTPTNTLGLPLPNFTLPGTDHRTYSPRDFADAAVLVAVFTCNHCPYAQAVRPRLIRLWEQVKRQPVQFVAINSNDESSYALDSFLHMQESRFDYPFPYLRDETQDVARQFGAVCTPDIFVYSQSRVLAYRGRFDDDWKDESKVTAHDLADALTALVSRGVPARTQHPSMGCSIKWRIVRPLDILTSI